MRRRVGLTLIEVMVVTVIVVVIISILVPSLMSARRTARRAQCLSNVRQLGLSFMNYSNQYGGKLVNDGPMRPGSWMATLSSYNTDLANSESQNAAGRASILANSVGRNRIIMCPETTNYSSNLGTVSLAWGPNAPQAAVGSTNWMENRAGAYGINAWLYGLTARFPAFAADNDVGLGKLYTFSFGGDVQASGKLTTAPGTVVTINGGLEYGTQWSPDPTSTVNGVTPTASTATLTTAPALPSVSTLATALAATGTTIPATSTTLDFSSNSVLVMTSGFSGTNPTVIGSGTLVVLGNFGGSISGSAPINIVCTGDFNGSCSVTGSVYVGNQFKPAATFFIGGVLMGNAGAKSLNASGTIAGGNPPPWDPRFANPSVYGSPIGGGFSNLVSAPVEQVPVFADCIWPWASPSSSDNVTGVNTSLGDYSTGLGRYYIARHGKAVNVAFLDGHAVTVPLSGLKALKWSSSP